MIGLGLLTCLVWLFRDWLLMLCSGMILLNYAHIDEFLVNIDIFCGLICFLKSDDERL